MDLDVSDGPPLRKHAQQASQHEHRQPFHGLAESLMKKRLQNMNTATLLKLHLK
jgi:hypothetical protein